MANGDNGLPRYGWGHVVVGREEVEEEIVDKFVLTFSNGDYDDEFDHSLSLNNSLTFPARPSQALYNKPDNWVERSHWTRKSEEAAARFNRFGEATARFTN